MQNYVTEHIPGLALTVIDEEQRHGVQQREALVRCAVHTLFMSATPIPRALALLRTAKVSDENIIAGSVDLSILDEEPDTARRITTSIVDIHQVDEVVKGLARRIELGARTFWIVPVIGEYDGEIIEDGNPVHTMTVIRRFQHLCDYLGALKVGMIHGLMTSSERSYQLDKFASTEDCVLLTDVFKPESLEDIARKRLDVLRRTFDGAEIAEYDLMLRGPGEKTGTKQAGMTGVGLSIDLRHHWELERSASIFAQYLAHHQHKKPLLHKKMQSVETTKRSIRSTASKESDIITEHLLKQLNVGVFDFMTQSEEKLAFALRVWLAIFGRWDIDSEWSVQRALHTMRDMRFSSGDSESILQDKIDDRFLLIAKRNCNVNTSMKIDDKRVIKVNSTIMTSLVKPLPSTRFLRSLPQKISFSDQYVTFLIVDIETTGLSQKSDYIIQLAAKVLGQEGTLFNEYIAPPVTVPKQIEMMTGISNDFLRNGGYDQVTGCHHKGPARNFEEVYNDFCSYCHRISRRGVPLVMIGHNCAFDLRMLQSEINRIAATGKREDSTVPSLSRDTGIVVAVDSLRVMRSKKVWKASSGVLKSGLSSAMLPSSFGLAALYLHIFGESIENSHNAISDVLALERILLSPSVDKWRFEAEKLQLPLNIPLLSQ